jgi:predicted phosphoadenosine phosphosulfate sulfurtransferase
VLLIDLEAQYKLTIAHAEKMFAFYAEWIDLHLLSKTPAKPFNNSVSKLPSTTPAKK